MVKNTISPIERERWERAQDAEYKEYWDHRQEISWGGFANVFRYLGVDPKTSFKDKVLVEVAAGSVPALMMVEGAKRRVAIEPLMARWDEQRKNCEASGVEVVAAPYEEIDISEEIDETWLFNCIEHVINPEEQMQKAMDTSKIVRMFEPIINTTSLAHPHPITKERIIASMGDFGQIYKGGEVEENFHQANCYYGTWIKEDYKSYQK